MHTFQGTDSCYIAAYQKKKQKYSTYIMSFTSGILLVAVLWMKTIFPSASEYFPTTAFCFKNRIKMRILECKNLSKDNIPWCSFFSFQHFFFIIIIIKISFLLFILMEILFTIVVALNNTVLCNLLKVFFFCFSIFSNIKIYHFGNHENFFVLS